MKRFILKSLVAAVAFASLGMAHAQEKTIKFATQNPDRKSTRLNSSH